LLEKIEVADNAVVDAGFDEWTEVETNRLRQYHRRGYIDREIAYLMDCCDKTIQRKRKKYGLPTNKQKMANGPAVIGNIDARLSERKKAERGCDNLFKRLAIYHPEKLRDIHKKNAESLPDWALDQINKLVEKLYPGPPPIETKYKEVRTPQTHRKRRRKKNPAAEIIEQVAEKHDINPIDIIGPWRGRLVIPARFEAAYRMRAETNHSYPKIGKILGGRDHTTIMHAVKTHAKKNGLSIPGEPA